MSSLAGKTLFITGATRGIGHAIGMRAARDGANIVIAAKSTEPHPKLPGTIFTAAEDMEGAGGQALAVQCDIRDDDQILAAVDQAVDKFGGIDICVNNASAISLTDTPNTPMKRYDLMHGVNARGTYATTAACLPHLKKAENPHVLTLAAVFSILTRLEQTEQEGLDPSKKARLYAGEDAEGFSNVDVPKLRAQSPDEGLYGVSPRFVINAISNAITRNDAQSLTSMEMLLALKDAIESDARMEEAQKKKWIDHLVVARKDFYNRWVKEDVHRALFASFEDEAQQLLEKYLDEVEGSLDKREIIDPISGEARSADERFMRSVEEKIKVSDSGKLSFRQEVVRKAMVAFKAGEKFTLESHARLHEAIEQYLFEERRDVLRLVASSSRPDEDAEQKISAVQQRLVNEYGYDAHSASEALNYVTTLLSQE